MAENLIEALDAVIIKIRLEDAFHIRIMRQTVKARRSRVSTRTDIARNSPWQTQAVAFLQNTNTRLSVERLYAKQRTVEHNTVAPVAHHIRKPMFFHIRKSHGVAATSADGRKMPLFAQLPQSICGTFGNTAILDGTCSQCSVYVEKEIALSHSVSPLSSQPTRIRAASADTSRCRPSSENETGRNICFGL